MRRVIVVLLVAASLALGACAAKRPKPAPPAAPAANEGAQGSGANNANAAAAADEEGAGPQAGLLATRVVYFDFDSSEIKGTGTDVVAAHAKYLAAHSATRVRLEDTPTSAVRASTTSGSASAVHSRCAARCCCRAPRTRRSPR